MLGKRFAVFLSTLLLPIFAVSAALAQTEEETILEANKEIARGFYQDLWFSDNTDNYVQYVADEYVVHDIWDRKGVTEPAIEQKNIADFFWDNGEFKGAIDYQIADGDLVATRWTATFFPKTLFGKMALRETKMSIINVFRIENGKIVEIWNHRHDIETSLTDRILFKGLAIGLLIGLIPAFYAWRLRKKLKALQS
ncbi:MAG: ester cyclase [Alphaproteobacteria bacterium]|nr:ester cyclase [Alphaproteobacteria bacterium]